MTGKAPLAIGAFCLIATGCATTSSIGDVDVTLRSGAQYSNAVRDVAEWGIWMSDGTSVLFRQLSTITTTSDSVATLLTLLAPAARVDTVRGNYTLNFSGIVFPNRPPPPERKAAAVAGHLELGPHVSPVVGLDTHFGITSEHTGPLELQLGNSVGWNVLEGGGFFGGITAGVIANARRSNGELGLGAAINVWKRYAKHEDERSAIGMGVDAISLGLRYSWPLDFGGGRLTTVARYYVHDISYAGYRNRFAVVFLLRRDL